jgi:hypothetical protein
MVLVCNKVRCSLQFQVGVCWLPVMEEFVASGDLLLNRSDRVIVSFAVFLAGCSL